MKVVLVFAFTFVAIASAANIPVAADKYTTKYDNIDLDAILKNDRLLGNYFRCLKGEGLCTPEGAELKRIIPDALQTGCSKCSENQRKGTERAVKFLIQNKPKEFKELEAIYDPNGIYRKRYESELSTATPVVPASPAHGGFTTNNFAPTSRRY